MSAPDVLLNDFARQWEDVGADVLEAVRAVGASGWYILGHEVSGFESHLARQFGANHAVGCASGLDAIELCLRSLGIRPGNKVLTTPLSAFATTLAIVRAGGIPVFCDTDDIGLLDLDAAARVLQSDSSIRFMVPVHLYGHALDLDRLDALKSEHRLRVVEDSAQSIGARWGSKPVGSVAQASATSFYPTKNLGAFGDAGAILTSDEALQAHCRKLRDYGQSAKYVHDVIGLNSRLDELHAAILGRVMLPRLPAWTQRRREIARTYLAELVNPRVTPLPPPTPSVSVWHLFPVRVAAAQRQAFAAHLRACGVHSGLHYPRLIPDQAALRNVPFEIRGELSRARHLADSELSLPIHPYLGSTEIARVLEAVNNWSPA